MTSALAPPGMRVEPDPTLKRQDDGRIVIGGSPPRILRLTDAGASRLDCWLSGEAVRTAPDDRRLLRRLLQAGIVHPVEFADSAERTMIVVVPVRDDADGLERLLSGLGSTYPVVVVDDGSIDGADHARVAEAAGASYLRRDIGQGPGSARNHGLHVVDSELVAFVDADVTLDAQALSLLVEHFADTAVVAVAPRVRSRADDPRPLASYEAVHSPLDLGPQPSPVGPGCRVSYVPAACLVVRADAARTVGGFDSALRWGEDVDFIWRLAAAGHTIRYDPAVEVGHRPRPNLRVWIDQRRRYGASAAPLAARHGLVVAPARCSPWSAAAWGAVVAGYPMIGLGMAAGSTAALAARLSHLPDGPGLAARLGLLGHLHAGLGLARAGGRAWWPISLAVAASRRRSRTTLLMSFLIPPLIDWIRGPRPAGPLTTIGLRLADDLAYGLGVWEGMWKERSLAAIRPDLVTWPERGDLATDR